MAHAGTQARGCTAVLGPQEAPPLSVVGSSSGYKLACDSSESLAVATGCRPPATSTCCTQPTHNDYTNLRLALAPGHPCHGLVHRPGPVTVSCGGWDRRSWRPPRRTILRLFKEDAGMRAWRPMQAAPAQAVDLALLVATLSSSVNTSLPPPLCAGGASGCTSLTDAQHIQAWRTSRYPHPVPEPVTSSTLTVSSCWRSGSRPSSRGSQWLPGHLQHSNASDPCSSLSESRYHVTRGRTQNVKPEMPLWQCATSALLTDRVARQCSVCLAT